MVGARDKVNMYFLKEVEYLVIEWGAVRPDGFFDNESVTEYEVYASPFGVLVLTLVRRAE